MLTPSGVVLPHLLRLCSRAQVQPGDCGAGSGQLCGRDVQQVRRPHGRAAPVPYMCMCGGPRMLTAADHPQAVCPPSSCGRLPTVPCLVLPCPALPVVACSYTTTGSFSRSAINNSCGARTPLAGFVTSMIVMCVLLFLTPIFKLMPYNTMGAIIIVGEWCVAALQGLDPPTPSSAKAVLQGFKTPQNYRVWMLYVYVDKEPRQPLVCGCIQCPLL